MPHKCIRCGLLYGSGSEELLKGCSCGSRIFMFIKQEQVTLKEQMEILERESKSMVVENQVQLDEIAQIAPISIERAPDPVKIDLGEMSRPLEIPDVNKIAENIRNENERQAAIDEANGLAGTKTFPGRPPAEKPVENITILEKGRYVLDLNSLMHGSPMVIKSEHGVFYIRIPTSAEKHKKKGRK